MKVLRLIFINIIRNPRRTALTVLSITACIFLVSTLQAVLNSLDSLGQSNSSNLRLVVHRATGMTETMPVSYKQRIAALPGVRYVDSVDWFGGYYADPANFFANFATDVDDFDKITDELVCPPDQMAAWKRERTAALVGRKLMENYGWKVGDRVTLKGTIYPVDLEFVIRGVSRILMMNPWSGHSISIGTTLTSRWAVRAEPDRSPSKSPHRKMFPRLRKRLTPCFGTPTPKPKRKLRRRSISVLSPCWGTLNYC